jgi:hypothetical protein
MVARHPLLDLEAKRVVLPPRIVHPRSNPIHPLAQNKLSAFPQNLIINGIIRIFKEEKEYQILRHLCPKADQMPFGTRNTLRLLPEPQYSLYV